MIKSNFTAEIENLCKTKQIEYIDAVIHWCDLHKLDVETAAFWIKKDATLKSKIQSEAENLNILKRGSKLPV